MNRSGLLFIAGTALVVIAIGFFYLKPEINSSWQTWQQIGQDKQKLSDINKKKEILSKLAQNNQLDEIYKLAENYIPQEEKSGEMIVELSGLATGSNLKVEQISLENNKTGQTASNADTSTSSTANTPQNNASTSGPKEITFSMKMTGSFSDFQNFIKNLETSSRLITINAMTLSQTQAQDQAAFSAQIEGKAYWIKNTSLEKNLANMTVSQDIIDKFKNLKTYGTPVNLQTESGFGRTDPFSTY